MSKETEKIDNLIREITKGMSLIDRTKVIERNGHKMIRPYYNGFMQEQHYCRNSFPCEEPSRWLAAWEGSTLKCDKCGQRYILVKEGWLLISDLRYFINRHSLFVSVIIYTAILAAIYFGFVLFM